MSMLFEPSDILGALGLLLRGKKNLVGREEEKEDKRDVEKYKGKVDKISIWEDLRGLVKKLEWG